MNRSRPKFKRMIFACVSVGSIGLSASASEVIRTEIVNSSSGSSKSSGGGALPTSDAEQLCIDGREYKVSDPTNFLPSEEKLKDKICPADPPKTNLCSKWDQAKKSYSAAAKALGVPLQVLMCITNIESTMNAGLTSKAGAKGLTQFMPGTAEDYQRKFKSDPEYKKAWDDYQKLEGTSGSASRFTKGNIVSNSLDASDVQIFATAMFLRDNIRNTESYWKKRVGEPPQVISNQMTKLFHFLVVSYNAGPAFGEQFIKGELDNSSKLPKETQDYINKMDSCIESPNRRRLYSFLESLQGMGD